MALETAVLDVVGNGVVTMGSIGSAEARTHQFFEEESRTKKFLVWQPSVC